MAYCLSATNTGPSQKKLSKKTKSFKKDYTKLGSVNDRITLNMSPSFQFGMKPRGNNESSMCKTPTRQVTQQKFAVPVNKIDLTGNGSSTRPKNKRRSMSKTGKSPSFAQQRSSSQGSNYDSDFSANTGGITLANQRELTEDEFYETQDECMRLIRSANDTLLSLEFKKKFNTIKQYCKFGLSLMIPE